MAVLLDSQSRVLAVGSTGPYGRAQVDYMRGAGTRVCGLVSAGRGGDRFGDLTVYDTVAEAVAETGADAAMIYTPALGIRDAILECSDAGMRLSVVAAEFVPVHDALYGAGYARERGLWVVGPNTVGMATPGVAVMGGFSAELCRPGRVGVIGRSGTLSLNVVRLMSAAGIGQSTIVHVGGDMLCGRNPDEWLTAFSRDPETDAIVYMGEIGGSKEYRLAEAVADCGKPVVALIVGRNAPQGKRMGHAGAMVEGERGTAAAKIGALRAAGAHIASSPSHVVETLEEIMA